MEENGLTVKKLGFFDRIRKSLFLRNMTRAKTSKFFKLPYNLKNDPEVIEAVVEANEDFIVNVNFSVAKELIARKPELINKYGDPKIIARIINEKPELAAYIDDTYYILPNLIYSKEIDGSRDFIKYLSPEFQEKLLTETIEYSSITKLGSRDNKAFGYVNDIKQYFNKFSEDVLISVAAKKEKENINAYKSGKYNRKFDNPFLQFDINTLSQDAQLKFLEISDDFIPKVSGEVLVTYVGNNPLLFDRLTYEQKNQMVKDNPEILAQMPLNFQNDYTKNISGSYRYSSLNYNFDVKSFSNADEIISRLAINRGMGWNEAEKITDIRNNDIIWEVAKYEPKVMGMNSNNNAWYRNIKLAENFKNHIQMYGSNTLTEFVEGVATQRYRVTDNNIVQIMNNLSKFMLNEDFLKAVPGDEILEYAKNPTNENLADLVRRTYGEKSAKIIEDRPKINMDMIPNLYIFKPEIIEEFGIGAVHANLSYTMPSSGILSELARKPELMRRYKTFNEAMGEFYEDTAISLDEKLTEFMICKDLLQVVDFSKLTKEQKDSLKIALLDAMKKDEPAFIAFPKTIDEIDSYVEKRNLMYDEAIKKEKDPKIQKQYISRRFFGMDYGLGSHTSGLRKPTVREMVNAYHVREFVKNPITHESNEFSEEELDMLELLDIFSKIDNPEILRDLAETLSKKENVLNPLSFNKIVSKVPRQYTKEMADAIISPEKALKMIEDGTPGITAREEDGVTIIRLEGADFKAYISNPFMDNSKVGMITAMDLSTEWNEKEDGVSTISGCVIDQDEMTSCVSKGDYGLGFGMINPYQILGMGITDIHASHIRRELYPYTTENAALSFDYPEEFMKKYEQRLNIRDSYGDSMHKYDEMTILRREERLLAIEEGTFGGKIKADYIFSYGTNVVNAVSQAKKCGIKFVFEYDETFYRGRYHERRYEKETVQPNREASEFIKEVKEIVGDIDDGR